jgi:hypothetical protein
VPGFVNYKKGWTRLAAASDKVYQLLAHGWWFSRGTPASSTTKTGRHDIAEILLKVALNTKHQSINHHLYRVTTHRKFNNGQSLEYLASCYHPFCALHINYQVPPEVESYDTSALNICSICSSILHNLSLITRMFGFEVKSMVLSTSMIYQKL